MEIKAPVTLLAAICSIILIAAFAGSAFSTLSDSTETPSTLPQKEAGKFPEYDGFGASLPEEISIDEAARDETVTVRIPKRLPPNAKLDTVRRSPGREYCITQYYDLGEEWVVWKDGVECRVMCSNMSREEVVKITESMF